MMHQRGVRVAIYRLPGAIRSMLVMQQRGYNHTNASSGAGFVIAPFDETPSSPAVIIRPDVVRHFDSPSDLISELGDEIDHICKDNEQPSELSAEENVHPSDCSAEGEEQPSECSAEGNESRRKRYEEEFGRCKEKLEGGALRKIVLARHASTYKPDGKTPSQLFAEACRMYPNAFVALFTTPESGTWLTATPEILIEEKGGIWHTVALAGTMNFSEKPQWSEKNRTEQRLVAEYIESVLTQFSDEVERHEPVTIKAGALAHLKTDFNFTLRSECTAAEVVTALHPTPAVCGLPKQAALEFILSNEVSPRKYYSGFCGPAGIDGETHLFVSLRCMKIEGNRCDLYAGGGILLESELQSEWEETETKMLTMKNLL